MKSLLCVPLGILVTMCIGTAHAGIELESPPATVGKSTTILITGDDGPVEGRLIKATYAPGSAVKRLEELGRTDIEGRLQWTPQYAGLAELSTDDSGSKTVAVRFQAMPTSALLVFLAAGILLFGGITLGVSRMKS